VGVWFLNEWITFKKIYGNDLPDSLQLIEMGPGKGTLMNDVLRVNNF
jgi:SAM-dependent MidA family methyltransferase